MGDLVLKGSTSGQITITPTGVAGTNTLTLPAKTGNIITSADSGTVTGTMLAAATVAQSNLATNIAGNGPAFSAYQSSAQTIPSGTDTKLQFQAKDFDTASCFDATTNYRFTPTVAGYYQINGIFWPGASATSNVTSCNIRKNGSVWFYGNQTLLSANVVSSVVSSLVYLNGTTDYVELWCYQASGSSLANYCSGRITSQFSGSMVRAA